MNHEQEMAEKAEKELARLTPERREQLQREMHGPNGYPTFEHEKACGYNPFESM